jgi:hypothetical protein
LEPPKVAVPRLKAGTFNPDAPNSLYSIILLPKNKNSLTKISDPE